MSGVAEDLPFASDCFDAVVGSLVMCSVNEPQMMLSDTWLKKVGLHPEDVIAMFDVFQVESNFFCFTKQLNS